MSENFSQVKPKIQEVQRTQSKKMPQNYNYVYYLQTTEKQR